MGTTTRKLYWVWTADHQHDWFQVATSAEEAEKAHVTRHRYDSGDAHCRLIAELPADMQDEPMGRPDGRVIEACGGEPLDRGGYGMSGDVYVEGQAVRRSFQG